MSQLLPSVEHPINALIQGASRGIGLGFVNALLADPGVASVTATCRSPEDASELQRLKQANRDRLRLLSVDLEYENTIAEAARELAATTDELHLLINCAGVLHDESRQMMPERQLLDIEPRHALHAFTVNSLGPILMAKHFHPFFRHRDRAFFANISARVGSIEDNHIGGWYSYRATKAAQNMFTRTMAIELSRKARSTVCVALHPGTVDTDLSHPFQGNVRPEKLFSVERAVGQLLGVLDGLTMEDSGGFFAWDGKPISF